MARPNFINSDNIIKEIIRVNHAGEYGAKRIYQGQLNYCKNHEASSTIKHMMQQEEVHLSYFTNLLLQRNVRPTILIPFWHIIGYILGSGSILIGTKTAMLLTQSVEEVIEQHYQKQIDYLELYNLEKELVDSIKQFQAEEIEHKDIALVYSNDLENWNVKQGVSERSVHEVREYANTPQFCETNSSKQKSLQGSSKVVLASLINKVIKLMCNMAINVSKKV